MPLRKMILAPDADGYGQTEGADWIGTQLDGGIGKYRRDKVGSSRMVNAKWTLNPTQFAYWEAFYALVGSGTFLCDLVGNDGLGPQEHECHIIPGSVGLPQQRGLTYVRQVQLEVKPRPRDAADDEALLIAFENASGELDTWYLSLERLITTLGNSEAFNA